MVALFSFATLLVLASGQSARLNQPPVLMVGGVDVVDGGAAADQNVRAARPEELVPLVWRAVAHGARVISVESVGGRASLDTGPWVQVTSDITRQFQIHGALLAQCRPGPSASFEGRPPAGVEVTLLEAQRSWVVIATNVSAVRARVGAVLPRVVPYALWLNLLDGSSMAMLEQDAGPKWAFEMAPRSVKMYVIDKTLK